MLELERLSSPFWVRERHRSQGEKGRFRCILCEKPLKLHSGYLHICLCSNTVLAKGERCPRGCNADGEGGCGVFPVGSECLKQVPLEYRF